MTGLKNNKGETLMEGVASLLILSILLMAVSMMINTSLRITATYTSDADEWQKAANIAILKQAPAAGSTPSSQIILTGNGNSLSVTIPVEVTKTELYTSFLPPEVPPS